MLTHKRIVANSLVITMVLASLILIPSVKATIIAEMPPYDDKWTLTGGKGIASVDANLTEGNLTGYAAWWGLYEVGSANGEVKMWKNVWLPAGTISIDCLWKLKGHYYSKFLHGYTLFPFHLHRGEPQHWNDMGTLFVQFLQGR